MLRITGDAWQKPTDLIQFGTVDWLLGIKLVQAVEPRELEQLLGEEEATNELRHGTPERQVRIMDVQHVGGGKDAILLGCEVVDETCWRLSEQVSVAQESQDE